MHALVHAPPERRRSGRLLHPRDRREMIRPRRHAPGSPGRRHPRDPRTIRPPRLSRLLLRICARWLRQYPSPCHDRYLAVQPTRHSVVSACVDPSAELRRTSGVPQFWLRRRRLPDAAAQETAPGRAGRSFSQHSIRPLHCSCGADILIDAPSQSAARYTSTRLAPLRPPSGRGRPARRPRRAACLC